MASLFQDLCSAFFNQSGHRIINSYDEYGNRTGHCKINGNDGIVCDEYGNTTGYVRKELHGGYGQYDKYGNRIGYFGK